jgi:hypothetical protein
MCFDHKTKRRAATVLMEAINACFPCDFNAMKRLFSRVRQSATLFSRFIAHPQTGALYTFTLFCISYSTSMLSYSTTLQVPASFNFKPSKNPLF